MLKVIYEDNHIIVVVKPYNIPSQADKTADKDMLTFVKEYIKDKYNKPGNVYLGLVHRLDRPVGGLMVFAKTSKAASRLSESIRTKEFSKTYLAIVNGSFEKKTGVLEDYLWKDEALNMSKVVSKEKHGAKLARLTYEVIQSKDELSLVKINLETGRHHQIRVQFANAKHSLYGDQKYGKGPSNTQIALWAYGLNFKHPVKDEVVEFEALPEGKFNEFDLSALCKKGRSISYILQDCDIPFYVTVMELYLENFLKFSIHSALCESINNKESND